MPATKSAHGGSQSNAPATKSAHRGSQSAVPATNSAHGGSQSAVPATKSAHRGSQSAVPATNSAHGGSQSAVPATKSAHGCSQSTVPATNSAHGGSQMPRTLHMEVHKVLCLPRKLHMEVHKVLCLPRNLHIEVHKVLCLPRTLHGEKQKSRLEQTLVHSSVCHTRLQRPKEKCKRLVVLRNPHIWALKVTDVSNTVCKHIRQRHTHSDDDGNVEDFGWMLRFSLIHVHLSLQIKIFPAGVSPMKPWAMCWLPHATSVAFRRTRSSCRPWRQQGCEALRASVPRPFLLRRFWCLSCSAGGHQTFRYSCASIGTIRFWYCHWKLHSSGYRIPPLLSTHTNR